MRPTESSTALPPVLAGCAVAALLATLTLAALPRDFVLYRCAPIWTLMGMPAPGTDGPANGDLMPWTPTALFMSGQSLAGHATLVVFVAPGEAASDRLAKEVLGDRWTAGRLGRGFLSRRVERDGADPVAGPWSGEELTAAYHVQRYPTVLVLDPERNVLARVEGYPGWGTFMHKVLPFAAQ